MKTIVFISLFIVGTVVGFAQLHEEHSLAMGKEVEIDLQTGGSLNITGWEKEQVLVEGELGGRDGKDCKVNISETDRGLSIESEYRGYRRNNSTHNHFDIHVPRKCNLDITSMGGAIEITGVEGNIEGQTNGGELTLDNLKGKVHLRTLGGKISLEKSEVDGEVSTNGGRVLITDVKGNVKGNSLGGAVEYRNVTNREGESSGAEVNISTMGGPIHVDDAPAGANVSTMGGRIEIHSAADHVHAKTMGGNITLDKVDGWIDATTMGGDIEATMVGDPSKGKRDVYLSSMSGDVTLTVPDGLSMAVDIELSYTRGHDKGKIFADFPLKQEETEKWDYDNGGTPRKYVYGKGTIGGGHNTIRISTINGDVYLKKGK